VRAVQPIGRRHSVNRLRPNKRAEVLPTACIEAQPSQFHLDSRLPVADIYYRRITFFERKDKSMENVVQFCEEIAHLTAKERKWWEKKLKNGDVCEYDFEGDTLYLFAFERSFPPDEVAALVQDFLRACRPNECWSLSYCQTCTQAKVGQFGGGALFVTADNIDSICDGNWVNEQRAVFANKGKDN
jgi:hypothetical protein